MDLTVLATDRGSVPMNIGAVLEFDTAGGPSCCPPCVPSCPNECRRFPDCVSGCSAFGWVAYARCGCDPDFVLDQHLIEREWPTPGGDRQLLDVAAESICHGSTRRPLWRGLVTDPVGGQAALILVLHHVLADGLGGLAVLAALADPGLPAPTRTFPRRPPQWRELAADAAREKLRAINASHHAATGGPS